MVSSFPHPPAFLAWMRDLFAEPQQFIEDLMTALVAQNATGVNIDFEPTGHGATAADAAAYARFLAHLETRLAAIGLRLTVDVAAWGAIWNYTEISAALAATPTGGRGAVATMSTYTNSDAGFLAQLGAATAAIAAPQLVVGLMIWPAPFNVTGVQLRFDALARRGLCRVAVWRMPLAPYWWGPIHAFAKQCRAM
jgi:hypothetical protein